MAETTSFLLKKLEKMEFVYAFFSRTTNLPYVECDPETYEDCVFLFTDQEDIKKFGETFNERKVAVAAGQIPGNGVKNFLSGLHFLGINAVRLVEGANVTKEELSNMVPTPDLTKLKEEKLPKVNPEMQLTAMYFVQELRRPVERTLEEKKLLKELEEEMAVNMMRSRWIVCVDVTDVTDDMTNEEKNKHVKVAYVKTKDGAIFQPIFSDLAECQKFNAGNKNAKLRLQAVAYDDLPRFLMKTAKGYALNPKGFNLLLTSEQMEQMKKYRDE